MNEKMPGDGMLWDVVTYNGARDNVPKARKWDVPKLVKNLAVMQLWTKAKVDAPAWSPVAMVEGTSRRLKANVKHVSCLVLDCDNGEPLDVLERLGDEYVRIGHTSWSHSPAHPKARVVFPLATPCPVEHWPRVWAAAAEWAASQGVAIDKAAKDCSRLYFGPFVGHDPSIEPPDMRAREWFESWVYGPAEPAMVGALPTRRRELLRWPHLISAWEPEPEDVPTPPPPLAMAGTMRSAPTGDADRLQWRRERFALGCVDHRVQRLAGMGPGGRHAALYSSARTIRGLHVAGALPDVGGALAALRAAALAAGVRESETDRTIADGYAKGHGEADGPFPLDDHMTPHEGTP